MTKKSLLKEALESLRTTFSTVSKLAFAQFEDEDGNVYQYSVLEVGAEVFKAGADGSEPAPNGEYKVDENTTITVEEGRITDIKKFEKEADGKESEAEVEVKSDEFSGDLRSKLKATGKFEDAELDALLEDFVDSEAEKVVVAEEVAESEAEAELITELVEGVSALVEEVKQEKAEIAEVKAEIEALKDGFAKFSQSKVESKLEGKFKLDVLEPNKESNRKDLQSIFSRIGNK